MQLQELIFSDQLRTRLLRHALFWITWWIYFALMHAVSPFGAAEISYFRNLPFTLTESVLLLIPQMMISYFILYLVFPLFLSNLYVRAMFLLVIGFSLLAILNLYMVMDLNPRVLTFLLPAEYLRHTQRPEGVSFFMAILAAFKGALVPAAMAIGIKSMKNWRLREERNLQLQREKAEAQLQLLTAQIHPHFLFNTLNNIYSQTQMESPKGSEMIMELSHLLRYILYEGRKSQVPLANELQMLVDYVNLEKIRYGNSLALHLYLPEPGTDLFIAPLILLPFIENCFKHGASNQLHRPWINLAIEISGGMFYMKLSNGKSNNTPAKSGRGIGIQNVCNRLQMLYPGQHELIIKDEPDVYEVQLTIKLKRWNDLSSWDPASDETKLMAYAE